MICWESNSANSVLVVAMGWGIDYFYTPLRR